MSVISNAPIYLAADGGAFRRAQWRMLLTAKLYRLFSYADRKAFGFAISDRDRTTQRRRRKAAERAPAHSEIPGGLA